MLPLKVAGKAGPSCAIPHCRTLRHDYFPLCLAHWRKLTYQIRDRLYQAWLHKKAKTGGRKTEYDAALTAACASLK